MYPKYLSLFSRHRQDAYSVSMLRTTLTTHIIKSIPKPWPAGNNIISTNETNSAVAEHLMLSKTGGHGGTGIWKMQNSKISLLLLSLSYPRNVYWAPSRYYIYSDEQNRHGPCPLLLREINMKPIITITQVYNFKL